jgi:hypothetical protein
MSRSALAGSPSVNRARHPEHRRPALMREQRVGVEASTRSSSRARAPPHRRGRRGSVRDHAESSIHAPSPSGGRRSTLPNTSALLDRGRPYRTSRPACAERRRGRPCQSPRSRARSTRRCSRRSASGNRQRRGAVGRTAYPGARSGDVADLPSKSSARSMRAASRRR